MGIIRTLSIVLMLFGAAACETTSRTAVTLLSDADYLRASPEQRQADDKTVASLGELDARKEKMLRAYLPVQYGDDRTGYTIQCMRQPGEYNMVATYPGHNPPGMDGAVSEGLLIVMADKDCNIIYQKGTNGAVSTITLLYNVATQEDMARKLLGNTIPAVFNGSAASLISGLTNCNENCGMSLMVQGGTALAAANSEANSGANVNVSSGQCGRTACPTPD